MQIFAKVQYFCKRFKMVITLGDNCSDIITIMIAFNFPYQNFYTITVSLLEMNNKT